MELYELWIILQSWKETFTAAEFISVFPSPNPNKILYDLVKKDLVERAGWGIYKVCSPQEVLKKRYNLDRAYEAVRKAGLEYSFTGPDAVFIWTRGGYQADRSLVAYTINVKVKRKEIKNWLKFIGGKNVFIKGNKLHKTYFGIFYILYPEDKFSAENVDGFMADKLAETVRFCQKRIYAYEPALEMLDEMYSLGLKIKYRELKTNVG